MSGGFRLDYPRFGLVCITRSPAIRYRTITRKRLFSLSSVEQAKRLADVYRHNLGVLERAIHFCRGHGIGLYRITSDFFPSMDEPVGQQLVQSLRPELRRVGELATQMGIRLVFHPDQFVVLNSERPEVVEVSRQILDRFGLLLDLLEQPRSPWAAVEIHGGKGGRPDPLVEVIRELPEAVRSRLCLENDERAYGAREILEICQRAGVPMVFDAHHHLVKERLASYDHPSVQQMMEAARRTWPDPDWQMVHISNGRESLLDARHSDFIHTLPRAFRQAPWIEVEAKAKEEAIAQLQQLVEQGVAFHE